MSDLTNDGLLIFESDTWLGLAEDVLVGMKLVGLCTYVLARLPDIIVRATCQTALDRIKGRCRPSKR